MNLWGRQGLQVGLLSTFLPYGSIVKTTGFNLDSVFLQLG